MKTIVSKTILAVLLLLIIQPVYSQHPADTFPIVSLCNLDLNRTATKLSAANLSTVSPAVTGYKWNSGDGTTLNWRPQGITGVDAGCKQFSVVSWYGRHIDNPFPCNGSNADYRNRGSRVSFVDITDMDDIKYRHVLLVDENYNTFYDMHAGGLVIINDTLYAPDSRGATDAMYAFPLNNIKEVPSNQLSSFYNYGYILAKTASTTDSMPFNPSFVSYDWDNQEMVVGSFQNCPSNNCNTPQNNRMFWYTPGNVDRMTPFYDGLFGKMQGIGTATNLDNPNKKDVWVATSYGSTNTSRLYAFSYDFGINTVQNQSIDFTNNYAYFSLPPGIEDIHIVPTNDTIWTLTEFSPNNPVCNPQSSNQRYVFGLLRSDLTPPGACNGDVTYTQDTFQNDTICQVSDLTYNAYTDYVSYATFDKSDDTWIELNSLTDTLVGKNRSVFLWMKQSTTVSSESQVLVGMNTSSGGNVCNMQISTSEKLGVYDGANSHYGTTNVTDGLWHHVGYTYDETTGETKIYVDGVLEASYLNAQTLSNTDLISLGQEFDSGLAKGNHFEGEMTEVTFWDEILQPSDIALLMNATVSNSHPKRQNLKGYYPMNKLCGDNLTIVKDISGNNFDGYADGAIATKGVNIQNVEMLDQIPGFNSAAHFAKTWTKDAVVTSTIDSLVLNSPFVWGDYNLELQRGPFVINDSWSVSMSIMPSTMNNAICSNENLDVNGTTYNASNPTGTEVFSNMGPNMCDSVVMVDLTVLNTSSSTDVQSACESFTWIDGNIYTTDNNTATHTLTNAENCDSVVTLDLSVTNIDTTTSMMGITISATQLGATYQWLDCDNGNTPIAGANNQSFTPSISGNYAVSIMQNGCTKVSSCHNITVVGLNQVALNKSNIKVFPNPTTGLLNIKFEESIDAIQVRITTITGQEIFVDNYSNQKSLEIDLDSPAGIYLLEIASANEVQTIKIIKE